MGMHVDPAGHDVFVFGIDHARSVLAGKPLTDGHNFAAGDGNIGKIGVCGRNHRAVNDEGLKGHRTSSQNHIVGRTFYATLAKLPPLFPRRMMWFGLRFKWSREMIDV